LFATESSILDIFIYVSLYIKKIFFLMEISFKVQLPNSTSEDSAKLHSPQQCGWGCGSSGSGPAQQSQSSEFKSQYLQNQTDTNLGLEYYSPGRALV
jgi:hypothetical protein